ncbi:signal peptidase I [Teredinibacter waterburyi]|uniref:signal peptidase I n=1 Tax=Teredinibacter waterburyi TaxID=1500538 RepID=UPI00165F8557|nr:signal peptidase I [Teredinibacter waterburyi]
MDINLPLILLLAVSATGLVWLYDIIALRAPRKAAVRELDAQYAGRDDASKLADEGYQTAYSAVIREPAVVEYSKSFFPILLLVFVLRSFVIEPFQIPSESMVPTLEVGDFIAVNKFAYGLRLPVLRTKFLAVGDPQRGDVMVFFPPNSERYFIKRVIGLPGDTVRYTDNVLYVNGERKQQVLVSEDPERDYCSSRGGRYLVMDELLADEAHRMRKCTVAGRLSVDGTYVVPKGHYFMMGDNRDNSSDSRDWGPVPEERIVGKAFAIWMHWKTFFSIPSFSRTGSI